MKASVMLLLVFALLPPNAVAQGYTRLSLPDGATARLGKGAVGEVHYSPAGTRLAVASSIGIWLYDTATYQEIALIAGPTGGVSSVAFSPDGRTLATSGSNGKVRLWDVMTGKHKRVLTGHRSYVWGVAFSPDGITLASGSADRTVCLWDAVTGEQKLTLTGHVSSVYSVAFSPDGGTLAGGSRDGAVRLWDAVTGEHKLTLTGHTNWAHSVVFSPDGRTLASASYDGTVLLWKLRLPTTWGAIRRATVAEDKGHLGALSPSSNMLIPKETALLANYPNPFNPETWLPYHLADDAEVVLTIYDTKGVLVRQLDLGHQPAGYYTDWTKAAYWNGGNENGESVASGVYFYQLRAGDYIALRRMAILK